ncbi:hypothetical protein EV401DRAFT_2137124 [Pisolithus croceorrhizus]|nr:hypothetical protein EV401DRAFT_2137124 [Pisolithus croceorrhizus]
MDVDRASTNMSDTAAQMHIMPSALSSDDESLYESLYESAVDLDIKSKASVDDDKDVDVPPPHALDRLDLASSIKGLYRVLDLISEQGSGGLVDKIVLSQNTLETFLNIYIVKPIGVYGSKEEIVRLLSELRVVTMLWLHILADPSTIGPAKSTLRSGLYLLRPAEPYGHTNRSLSYTGLKRWERGCVDVEAQYKRVRTDGFNQVKVNLDKGEENLTSAIHEAVIDAALDLYPFLERESFRSPKVNQTTAPTSFRGLVELYPQMNETYRQNIKAVETISNDKFRDIKERLCLFAGAVSLAGSTSENQRREIAKAVLKEGLMAARNAVKEL